MTDTMLNKALAAVIMRQLKQNPDKCIRLQGRVGAVPYIRWKDDEWHFASWTGIGVKLDGTKDPHEVRKMLQEATQLEWVAVTDVEVWEVD